MDDTACETLQNALSHHNEWEGQNIMLSVNQSPDLDELADVDLAQCLGKAHGARLQHEKLGDNVGFAHLLSKPSAFLGNVQFSRCKESLNSQSILKLNFVKRVSLGFLFHRLAISAQVTV
jgi:hypothetical protein